MEILAPLNDKSYIEELITSGVTELYFGFHDEEWTKEFGTTACINRMSNFEKKANSIGVAQVCDVVRTIHKFGAKCYITLNAAQYSTDEMKRIASYLIAWEKGKPDGIIVSSLAEASLVLKHNMVPVASTMCGIYNSDIAKYYFKNGVQRMIFPREITLSEMKSIRLQCPEVQFEAFLMRNGCVFADTSCLGIHSQKYGSLCAALCSSQTLIQGDKRDFMSVHDAEDNSIVFHERYHHNTCGMCAIYRLQEIGVHSLKIVGRADDSRAIISDARLIRDNIEIARRATCEEEYLSKMHFPKRRFYMCKNGLSCYYPEIRFSE